MASQTELQQLNDRLEAEAQQMAATDLASLMHAEGRDALVLKQDDLWVDITRQPIRTDSLDMLCALAEARNLAENITQLFDGTHINRTEDRPVVHMGLRHPDRHKNEGWKQLAEFAEQLRNAGQITDVVNIGIGGSDLGPAMLAQALGPACDGPRLHFVGNVDPAHIHDVLASCTPEQTLFIVTSKTFTTQETLANATLATSWLERHGMRSDEAMVAVTAAPDMANRWGIDKDRIFSFEDGVGGRYSVWSAVGLAVMIGCGSARFAEVLAGAYDMDCHFRTAPFDQNLPVIMGLLRIWHRQFMGRVSYGLMAYDQRLARFAAWAQQLEMESNGKSVDMNGQTLSHPAAPLIWGEPGTNAQHSFFQWLHQGAEIHPIDILVSRTPYLRGEDALSKDAHRQLVINAIAQAEALALGQKNPDNPHQHFAGNRPSILVSWDRSTPFAIGRLLALYEHITIVSGFIWGINSFDQFGVELGKKMARALDEGTGLSHFSKAAQSFMKTLD